MKERAAGIGVAIATEVLFRFILTPQADWATPEFLAVAFGAGTYVLMTSAKGLNPPNV